MLKNVKNKNVILNTKSGGGNFKYSWKKASDSGPVRENYDVGSFLATNRKVITQQQKD
jgi:signal transduction histidine kinase